MESTCGCQPAINLRHPLYGRAILTGRVGLADQCRFPTTNRRRTITAPAKTSADRRRLLAREGAEAEDGNVTSPLSCMMAMISS
jgi:hypothetical protein